jgi:hypothetical protein
VIPSSASSPTPAARKLTEYGVEKSFYSWQKLPLAQLQQPPSEMCDSLYLLNASIDLAHARAAQSKHAAAADNGEPSILATSSSTSSTSSFFGAFDIQRQLVAAGAALPNAAQTQPLQQSNQRMLASSPAFTASGLFGTFDVNRSLVAAGATLPGTTSRSNQHELNVPKDRREQQHILAASNSWTLSSMVSSVATAVFEGVTAPPASSAVLYC